MDATGEEMRAIYTSLHLKEVVLQELMNDAHNRLSVVRALRKKFEQELSSDTKKEQS